MVFFLKRMDRGKIPQKKRLFHLGLSDAQGSGQQPSYWGEVGEVSLLQVGVVWGC